MRLACTHRLLMAIFAGWSIYMPGHTLELSYDPFKKPELLTMPPSSTAVSAQASTADQGDVEASVAPLEGELRATIEAGPYSMINVGGEILMLGDTMDGYRLVQVRETEAIFEKNGTQRTLKLD